MAGDSVQIMVEPWGPLVSAELRAELEAEGLEVEELQRLTESRGLPPWADTPVEVLAVVTILKEGATATRLIAAKVDRALHRWRERRRAGTPPRVSRVLGPDGNPLVVDQDRG
jgi:hypothetical protein